MYVVLKTCLRNPKISSSVMGGKLVEGFLCVLGFPDSSLQNAYSAKLNACVRTWVICTIPIDESYQTCACAACTCVYATSNDITHKNMQNFMLHCCFQISNQTCLKCSWADVDEPCYWSEIVANSMHWHLYKKCGGSLLYHGYLNWGKCLSKSHRYTWTAEGGWNDLMFHWY